MKRSKYMRPVRLTEQGEGGQKGASRLTTSAMIASGLKANESVVVQGMVGLADGSAIRTSE